MPRRGRKPKPIAPLPRRAPRRADQKEIVEVIGVAAERVLVERGLEGLSTNRVAELAGVSVGTLYHYYPNKAAIIRAVHERYTAQLANVLPRVVAQSAGESFRVIATRVADAYVDLFESQAPIHAALMAMRTESDLHDVIATEMSKLVDVAAAILATAGVANGDEARALAFTCVYAVEGIGNAIASGRAGPHNRQVARNFAEMAAAYLDARRAAP